MARATHVYGPVPSRRLGLSLGVDLVPYKVCCYDCIYCQLGSTTDLTSERASFVDPDRVALEVERALHRGPRPEVITLAGSGEPTLNQELEQVVAALRRVTDLPLCLLTNGGLLFRDEVRRAALGLDLVAPSLDAADAETFERVNRPAAGIAFDAMVRGLGDFCAAFRGRCQLEVVLVRGVNDGSRSLDALARLAASLEDVASVDLNTVVRPPAVAGVAGLGHPELERARERFARQGCPARIIVPFAGSDAVSPGEESTYERILETVARRPCTAADLSAALGLELETVRAQCEGAVRKGVLRREEREPGGEPFYLRR
jgi:wyosine [tRNA(Phe)-imidazoG37] synthetase (radical SAM superfamily)